MIQWGGLVAFVAKNPIVTSWHELLYELNQFSMFCTNFHAVTKRSQMHPNTTKHYFRVQLGGLGLSIAKNPDITSWHEFLHYLHEFTAFCTDFHAVTKQSQMHQNTTKVQLGGLGALIAKNPDVTSWHEL